MKKLSMLVLLSGMEATIIMLNSIIKPVLEQAPNLIDAMQKLLDRAEKDNTMYELYSMSIEERAAIEKRLEKIDSDIEKLATAFEEFKNVIPKHTTIKFAEDNRTWLAG